jgi:uncharacterized peroxidase-related enzyme
MPRISTVGPIDTPEKSAPILEAVGKKLGRVPNLVQTVAHSPAALRFYLAQTEALAGGVLNLQLREQIALVAAGINHCDYCASAHTLAGKHSGLGSAELAANLAGRSQDDKVQAALDFAAQILEQRGHISDTTLQDVRSAGYNEAEIVEIIAHVAMNIFTNYFNHIAGTAIDFPFVTSAPKQTPLPTGVQRD